MSWGTDNNIFLEAKTKQTKNNHPFPEEFPSDPRHLLGCRTFWCGDDYLWNLPLSGKKTRPGNLKQR
jgi:hypothetical protein